MSKRGDDSKVIPVPSRLTRPHRVVAKLQQAPEGLRVTKGCIGRALRILQALASESLLIKGFMLLPVLVLAVCGPRPIAVGVAGRFRSGRVAWS
jgi:hypothetical protein